MNQSFHFIQNFIKLSLKQLKSRFLEVQLLCCCKQIRTKKIYKQDRDSRFRGGFKKHNNNNNEWERLAPQLLPQKECDLYAEADQIDPTKIEYEFYNQPAKVFHSSTQEDIKPYLEFSEFLSQQPKFLQDAIKRMKFQKLTPIQQYSIPISLKQHDVLCTACTGSGKTAAFSIPVFIGIQNLKLKELTHSPTTYYQRRKPQPGTSGKPFCVVLTPTRELALQNVRSIWQLSNNSGILSRVCYGGESQRFQSEIIRSGCDIIVGTTGRTKDFIEHGDLDLRFVKYFVLDEADTMLDMGFIDEIKLIKQKIDEAAKLRTEEQNKIIGNLQTLMFSATFPKEIQDIAQHFLVNPYRVQIGEVGVIGKNITQILLKTTTATKLDFLKFISIKEGQMLVFCKTKNGVDTIVQELRQVFTNKTADQVSPEIKDQIQQMFGYLKATLNKEMEEHNLSTTTTDYFNDVDVQAQLTYQSIAGIHGDLSQQERTQNLANFKNKKIKILVATDVAQRGLDLPKVDFVINYDMPATIQDYTHRIGRTGRAGKRGCSITLVTEDENKSIMTDLRQKLIECDQLLPQWYDNMLRTRWVTDKAYGSRGRQNNRPYNNRQRDHRDYRQGGYNRGRYNNNYRDQN